MSSKEQVYDPAVDYYTDTESELSDTESGIDIPWSGEKLCYHSGGPQADNDGRRLASSQIKQRIGHCKMFVGAKKCNKKNVPLYKGNCYPCHQGTIEHQNQHNHLCYQCATGRNEALSDEVLQCFEHNRLADEDEEDPEPVMEAD